MKTLVKIKQDFLRTARVSPKFETNTADSGVTRGNYILDALAEKIFDHPRLLELLSKKIRHWLVCDDSKFTLALAGYIAYLGERYAQAERFFLKALQKDPKNIDLWMDLAFSLFHQDEKKQKLAHDILFKYKELAETFPEDDICLAGIRKWLNRQPPYRLP
jgi:tetratricopeptide (TPR) repeat protein